MVKSSYDPLIYPPFAVTVDIVVFSLAFESLSVLLVKRGEEPFRGSLALPGGFKKPDESLEAAARRELAEETGVEVRAGLKQFGAYGDPGRDPRMSVVTVAYLAVLKDLAVAQGGSDAADALFVPVDSVARGKTKVAFDHRRIIADAASELSGDIGRTGLAIDFVGSRFTLAQLRSVYERVWSVALEPGNFRRSLLGEVGWIIPTGKTLASGSGGGKPAELFRAGPKWKHGSPIHRPTRPRVDGVS
jgi:8-oxo-dGTP diphosphatase